MLFAFEPSRHREERNACSTTLELYIKLDRLFLMVLDYF